MAELVGREYLMGDIMKIMDIEITLMESRESSLVPVIIGDPGTGKSESIKALARRVNRDICILPLGAKTMDDYSGIPETAVMKIPAEYSTEGKTEIRITEWTMPSIVAEINRLTEKALKEGKSGLVVLLDDMHLADHIVQKYLFEFLQNKTLQSFRLHKDAVLIGAMNGKDSAGMEGFLSAIIDRLALYHAKFDKDFWYSEVGSRLHPFVASFAKGPNDRYFVGANSTDESSPSPRSWTEISNVIPTLEKKFNGDASRINEALRIMAEARVGKEASIEFMKHVKLFQKFDFESILNKQDPNFMISADISDQILTAFIIRYLRKNEDVDYLIQVMNRNKDRRNFISIFANEYEVILKGFNDMPDSESKRAFEYLSEVITDEDKVDEDLLDTIVDGVIDIS